MSKPRITHIFSGAPKDAETTRRMAVAKQSWAKAAGVYGDWRDRDLSDVPFTRDARSIGDPSPLPFIHDMVWQTMDCGDDDIILITNADVGVHKDIGDELVALCSAHGACYAYRWDFDRLELPLETKEQIAKGRWYVGCDAFAFTKRWWNANKDQLPDFVLGRECWDWILRVLIIETGGVELQKAIFHEKHVSPWKQGRLYQPGNVYNRSFARAWLTVRNIPLREIANAPFKPMTWTLPERKAPETTAATGMDVLIVLGKGSKWQDNELKYCLRSLEKHAKNMGRVFLIGQDPGFLNPEHVTILKREDVQHNREYRIAEQIIYASEKLPLSEHFLWVNDDTFLLEDTDISTYPYYNDGELGPKWARTKPGGYRVALMQTDAQLKARGLPTRNYEIHVPIIYSRRGLANPVVRKLAQISAKTPFGMTFRSVYCNVLGVIAGPAYKDMKLGNVSTAAELQLKTRGRHCFSIGDGLTDDAKGYLDTLFPAKSKYEL